MRPLVLAALLTLALAATAAAGGFATAGLDQMPATAAPGSTWSPEITVLGHGRTPADGVEPIVILTSGERTERFPARPAGRPGVYRADVTFPAAGRWSVAVDSGWGVGEDTVGAIDVSARAGTAAAPPSRSGDGLPPLVPAVLAGLAAALLTGAIQRRRHRRPAPIAA